MSLERPKAPDPYDLLPEAPSFTLTSDDIADGERMDERHAHQSSGGDNVRPHLRWEGFPDETKAFAVTCYDPDAPTGSGFWHWVAFNLPPDTTELPSGGTDLPGDAVEVRNDYGENAYGGPAPPPGDGDHRYVFAVHALDEPLELDDSASCAYVGFNITFHVLARATLRATYSN